MDAFGFSPLCLCFWDFFRGVRSGTPSIPFFPLFLPIYLAIDYYRLPSCVFSVKKKLMDKEDRENQENEEPAKRRKLPTGWEEPADIEALIDERTIRLEALAEECTRELEAMEVKRPTLKIEVPKREDFKRPRDESQKSFKLKLYKESKYTEKCPDFKGRLKMNNQDWSIVLWEKKTKTGKVCLSGTLVSDQFSKKGY